VTRAPRSIPAGCHPAGRRAIFGLAVGEGADIASAGARPRAHRLFVTYTLLILIFDHFPFAAAPFVPAQIAAP
jgi:hypothetical protein